MTEIITAIGTVITGFATWFGDIATALIANDLVLLMIGLAITGFVFGLVMSLVKKLKRR